MARFAPFNDSKVRAIKCSRACTNTCKVTSWGTWFSSINLRAKSNSTCAADGKPISISLKPTSTKVLKKRIFCSMVIGSISAWLPSRRSTLAQIGDFSIVLLGQVRSGSTGANANGRYLRKSKAAFFGVTFAGARSALRVAWLGIINP